MLKKIINNVKMTVLFGEGQVMAVNLREQEYICAIAKYRSVTKAAKELNITQAALSLFVQNLEKRLGVQLFERYKKEMIPTYVGEIYLESARRILLEGERFHIKLQEYFDIGKGRVRFGINSKRSPLVVPQLLVKMRELYPNVDIIVKESDTLKLTSMLLEDELDCIYSYENIRHHAVHSELLSYDRIGLVISSRNPQLQYARYDEERQEYYIDLNCLKDETFLLYENDETRNDFDRLTAEAGFKPKVQEYYNVETMLELAEKNYGILYMNEVYTYNFNRRREKDPLRFFMAGQHSEKTEVWLSYHERMLEQRYGREFIEIIRGLH